MPSIAVNVLAFLVKWLHILLLGHDELNNECNLSFCSSGTLWIIFLSLVRDESCTTTSMSAGQTLGCPSVLLLCWISVNMCFRGEKLQSRAWAPVGRGLQGAPLWLYIAVLALAAQVNAHIVKGCCLMMTLWKMHKVYFKQRFTIFFCGHLLGTPVC